MAADGCIVCGGPHEAERGNWNGFTTISCPSFKLGGIGFPAAPGQRPQFGTFDGRAFRLGDDGEWEEIEE